MDLTHIKNFEELKIAKHNFFGEGSKLKELQQALIKATPEEKKVLGMQIDKLKKEAEMAFEIKAQELEKSKIDKIIESQWIDVTQNFQELGSLHPLTLVKKRFQDWLNQNGYYQVFGSEIENDEYNFERLNIPKNHPAREMQDSLYFNENKLLRTHNTSFSARELEKHKNEAFSQYSIGKVYRNDEDDQTHSHQFMQIDLVTVGNDLSFPNLIWTLKSLLGYVLEKPNLEIRLRPSFFPFTEPSVEVDIWFNNRWIEVLGAGMIHENVLKMAGYTNKMNGFAAGMGIERIAMIKYGIKDIREFYKNDLRFLDQFKGGK